MLSPRRRADPADPSRFRALLSALVQALHAAEIAGASGDERRRADSVQQDPRAVVQESLVVAYLVAQAAAENFRERAKSPGVHESVAALAERGRPHFPSVDQAEPTRSATASTVAPRSRRVST